MTSLIVFEWILLSFVPLELQSKFIAIVPAQHVFAKLALHQHVNLFSHSSRTTPQDCDVTYRLQCADNHPAENIGVLEVLVLDWQFYEI